MTPHHAVHFIAKNSHHRLSVTCVILLSHIVQLNYTLMELIPIFTECNRKNSIKNNYSTVSTHHV